MKIVVNSIDFRGSFINGPGIRTLVFLQGCNRYCNGCHNKNTWNMENGIQYDILELAAIIKNGCKNRKITITGGEPMCQKDALVELLSELSGFDICLYTSCSLDEIPEGILSHLKHIKVGPYDKNLRCTTIPYIGSSNQTFITLR